MADSIRVLSSHGFKPLPKWRIMQLYPRAARGDQEAFDALLRSVMGLVLRYSTRPPKPYDVEDLVEMALMGFVRSVANRRWNPRRGAFTTYVMFYIKGARFQMFRDLEKEESTLSLDWDDRFLLDTLEDERKPEGLSPGDSDRLGLVLNRMSVLNEKQAWVVEARFLRGLTLEKAGIEMGVCKERIRQIEKVALRKLRDACGV